MSPDRPPPPVPHPSELTVRFRTALDRPTAEVRLDEACVLIAAHLRVGRDPDGTDATAVARELDGLAARVADATFDGVVARVLEDGFHGSARDYSRASASLLPEVLRRRRGLPISLAVVAVEVARRVGVSASVVGMPGHVLLGEGRGPSPRRLADPFHRAASVTEADARALFHQIHGPQAGWSPGHLHSLSEHAVVVRILSNLAERFRRDDRHRQEALVLGLRSMVPGAGPGARAALASALARSGRFGEAAHELEALASVGGAGIDPAALSHQARQWRARLN